MTYTSADGFSGVRLLRFPRLTIIPSLAARTARHRRRRGLRPALRRSRGVAGEEARAPQEPSSEHLSATPTRASGDPSLDARQGRGRAAEYLRQSATARREAGRERSREERAEMGRAASHRLLSRHSRLVAGVGIVGCSSPQARDRGCGCGGAVGFEGLFYSDTFR